MSTTIDPVVLQQLVAQAVRQLQKEGNQPVVSDISDVPDEYGVFTTMSDAINASESAQHMLLFQSPSQRQKIRLLKIRRQLGIRRALKT